MNGKKIVVIGGGHGTSIVLSSLDGSGCKLSGVLSMADDGGSTGRLRKELGVSAVGDIRQCLVSLATNTEVAKLFSYRFEAGGLNGHSLGNLVLSAGELQTGSIEKSIETAKKALGVSADIIPSTEDKCELVLNLGDKQVTGVYDIAGTDFEGNKPDLSLTPLPELSGSAKDAINEADFILIAPGNFYCSIMPALFVGGMIEAINGSKAKVIQICNLVNRAGQTAGFKASDYVEETIRLSGLRIHALIYNTAQISADCLRDGEEQVISAGLAATDYKLVGGEISDGEKVAVNSNDKIAAVRSLVRHDKHKLAKLLNETMENL